MNSLELHDVDTVLPATMLCDRGDERGCLLHGRESVVGVVTDQSRRREDTRAPKSRVHERDIRVAELVGREAVDAERGRVNDAAVSPSSRPNVGRESDVSARSCESITV